MSTHMIYENESVRLVFKEDSDASELVSMLLGASLFTVTAGGHSASMRLRAPFEELQRFEFTPEQINHLISLGEVLIRETRKKSLLDEMYRAGAFDVEMFDVSANTSFRELVMETEGARRTAERRVREALAESSPKELRGKILAV